MVQYRVAKVLHLMWVAISALEQCRKMKFRVSSDTNKQYNNIYKYCHASVNLDNVDVLYLENGNVDRPRPVQKNKTTTFLAHL